MVRAHHDCASGTHGRFAAAKNVLLYLGALQSRVKQPPDLKTAARTEGKRRYRERWRKRVVAGTYHDEHVH